MNRSNLPPSAARIWTQATLDCHARGCICEGCIYNNFLSSGRCRAKEVVMNLIRSGKQPPVKTKQIID